MPRIEYIGPWVRSFNKARERLNPESPSGLHKRIMTYANRLRHSISDERDEKWLRETLRQQFQELNSLCQRFVQASLRKELWWFVSKGDAKEKLQCAGVSESLLLVMDLLN